MTSLPTSYIVPYFAAKATDQGARGTCAVFSSISLLEYYFANKIKFSPQFLYACCKLAEDTENAKFAGTSIKNIFDCIQQFGVLPFERWPYNPNQTEDEAQITISRITEFETISLSDVNFHMLYTPSNIDEYKYILTGHNENRPMPIIVGCRIYSSSDIANDWLEMPPPGAIVNGGHAMLIYGYKDEKQIPGGGYFLAQNSWGVNWLKNNSGLLKIPYQYVVENAIEAGTVLAQCFDNVFSQEISSLQAYITIAQKNMKDAVSGIFEITAGDSIIVDEFGNARLDTLQNRKSFIDNGFAFWQKLSPELIEKIDKGTNTVRQFGSSLDVNIKGNVGKVIPNINLPTWVNFIPNFFNLKFEAYKEITVNKDVFCDFLSNRGVIPAPELLRTEDFTRLKSANLFRVYELSRGSIVFRIIAFFVTPVNLKSQDVTSANSSIYDALISFFKIWEKNTGVSKANCKCFVFATPKGWSNQTPVALHDNVQLLCNLNEESQWVVKHLALDNYRAIFRHFVYSLYPEKFDERCERIKQYIEGHNKFSFGNITISKLSKVLNIPNELVTSCCDRLQKTGAFLNYFANGEMAIRIRSAEEKNAKLIRFSQPESWFTRHMKGFLVALVGVLGLHLRGILFPQSLQLKIGMGLSVFILAICLYITTCIQGYLDRKLNK